MHGENYNTAKMLKRLQRQVSSLRGGDTEESVAVIIQLDDEAACDDDFQSVTLDDSARWAWSESAWSADTW